MDKIKLGISSCLMGEKVRYDGQHKLDRFLVNTLGKFVEWVPVCPEVECGMPVPREAMRLRGNPESPRLVTIKTGKDLTDQMLEWAENRLNQLAKENLSGYVFKSKSPSSGMERVKVYNDKGVPRKVGTGIFAEKFMKRFPLLPVEDDGRIHDPVLRENFIERVFVFSRWKSVADKDQSLDSLIDFHTRHKLLIMAHCPDKLSILGRLASGNTGKTTRDIFENYINELMPAFKETASVNKNVNALQHITGYFRNLISADEKQELIEITEEYHKKLIPLIVPVTLLNHYVRKYNIEYLKKQYYLNPHPHELCLRNHL